jgi:serine/threonine-protein kinase HipA
MALKLNGKDDRLTREDFLSLARTIDLPVPRAREILGEIDTGLTQALEAGLSLPGEMSERETAVLKEITALITGRLKTLR